MDDFQDLSYVHDIGSYRSDCGYCHSQTLSSTSFGMSAHSLTVSQRDDLSASSLQLHKPPDTAEERRWTRTKV